MAHDPLDDLVDGTQMMEKLSFEDLPGDVIMQITKKLDLRSRLRMRLLNKRRNRLQLAVWNNVESIELDIRYSEVRVVVKVPNNSMLSANYRIDELRKLVSGLDRLALNTHVDFIEYFDYGTMPVEEKDQLLSSLSKFDTENFHIYSFFGGNTMDLSTLVSLGQNIRVLRMEGCSFRLHKLCLIRKKMIEEECKLQLFVVEKPSNKRMSSFVKKCFGVDMEQVRQTVNGNGVASKGLIFRDADEPAEELYVSGESKKRVHHFEDNVKTTICGNFIVFDKCDGRAQPGDNCEKMRMNQFYEYDDSSYVQ